MPAPLVPPEVDLRDMPYMPLDVVRLLESDLCAKASGAEFKAAVTLWCRAWLQVPAGSLPNDVQMLRKCCGESRNWSAVKRMALRGFVLCDDGRLYHPVICEKALKAWRYRQSQRANAGARWGRKGDATAHATAHATAYPEAMPLEVEVNTPLNIGSESTRLRARDPHGNGREKGFPKGQNRPAKASANRIGAWWDSEAATIAYAHKLGIGDAHRGEDWPTYRARIREAERIALRSNGAASNDGDA